MNEPEQKKLEIGKLFELYEKSNNGKVTRFLNDLLSEVVFSEIFARFLRAATKGKEWSVDLKAPTSPTTKSRLDTYVYLRDPDPKAHGFSFDPERCCPETKIFACEVKGWNRNSFQPGIQGDTKNPVDLWKHFNNKYFKDGEPFAKLLWNDWRIPSHLNFQQHELCVALLIFMDVKNTGADERPFFMCEQDGRSIFVFRVGEYCRANPSMSVELRNCPEVQQKLSALKELNLIS